jgi:hypothetical protein
MRLSPIYFIMVIRLSAHRWVSYVVVIMTEFALKLLRQVHANPVFQF